MEKKKMLITAAIAAGVGYASYRYFKNNPGKFNMMKHKMKDAFYAFEDEMMM